MSRSIEITPELLAGFLDEAPEYLEMLDAGLMVLEEHSAAGPLCFEEPQNQAQMNEMFRAAHSLKGLAAAFGFEKIKELTHRMETLFDQIRMRKRDMSTDSFEVLFRVFDRLKLLVQELTATGGEPVRVEDIVAELDRILAANPAAAPPPPKPAPAVIEKPRETAQPTAPALSSLNMEILNDPTLLPLFIETTVESVDELSEGLLALESSPSDEALLNRVFRAAHNIKGATGTVGLVRLNRVTHNMETILDGLRSLRLSLDEELMGALLRTVDDIRSVVECIRGGQIVDASEDLGQGVFTKWLDGSSAPTIGSDPAPRAESPTAAQPSAEVAAVIPGAGTAFDLTVTFPEKFDEASIQAYLIHNKLHDLANILSCEPDLDSLCGDSVLSSVRFRIQTERDPQAIEEVIRSYSVQSVQMVSVSSPGLTPPSSEPATPTAPVTESKSGANIGESAPIRTAPKSPEATATMIPRSTATSPRPVAGPTVSPAAQAAPKAAKSDSDESEARGTVAKPAETLRVDQEKLDQLMNLGGELVINRARFFQIHGRFRSVIDGRNFGYLVDDISARLSRLGERLQTLDNGQLQARMVSELSMELSHLEQDFTPVRSLAHRVHDLRGSMHDFDEALHALNRVSDGIQKQIMGTRMVPIGPMFNRFKRVVRDIAKSSGKQIDLVLKGENTELDKRMIDELADPLTHMVRNSVDHGLEMPDVRTAAGKRPAGTVTLEASHRGNSICIQVSDDGAGMNLERIKAKALERELVTEAALAKMSEREIIQFVMMPGFSTAPVVTDLSGRGMGMDIVKSKIEKLSGTVELETSVGKGTRVTIKLPLTLAILTSMVARIGKGVYAMPLENVAEIIKVKLANCQYIQRRRVVMVREKVVPVVTLEEAFATSLPELQTHCRNDDELTLVIVELENEQLGLVVDELLGQEDVVIKSIAENYRNIKGIAGASIRGDGTVSLILDVTALIDMASKVKVNETDSVAVGA